MQIDYLTKLAIENIWCSPKQDMQVLLHPARLTDHHGAIGEHELGLGRIIPLPDKINRWYIYQVGGTHPVAFNLFAKCYTWVKIIETIEAKSMFVDLYTNSGYHLPLGESYYSWTADGNLIIAIKASQAPIQVNLKKEDIYLRVYSPAYFQTAEGASITEKIKTISIRVENNTHKAALDSFYSQYSQKKGHLFIYHNGYKLYSYSSSAVAVGDIVEMIFDSSVKKIIKLKIGNLQPFESEMDKKLKYIVHYEADDPGCIDYQDDIDFYVFDREKVKALYYNKNNFDAVRNLTHRDYSIVTTYLKRYAEVMQGSGFIDPLDMHLQMCIRHSGWKRSLVYESSLIHELYKMKDLDIQRAMSGIDSTVEIWHAKNLEKAAYPAVMRSECCSITPLLAINAWGYHAAAKYTADTPLVPISVSGQKKVKVPYRLQYGAGMYEYDANGLLLGVYTHWVGDEYLIQNAETALVEAICGWPSTKVDEKVGLHQLALSPYYDYRVYTKTLTGKIEDVSSSNKVRLTKSEYTWLATTSEVPILRSNKRHLYRKALVSIDSGLISIPISQIKTDSNGSREEIMDIPMGQLDVWLNGRSLIENLDYYVKDNRIFILNKKFLKRPINTEKQTLEYRYAGHCASNLERLDVADKGYIEHNLMSSNRIFDLRDDRVLRIIINGQYVTKDALGYGESTPGVAPTSAFNGMPYMVKDVLVPIQTLSAKTTNTLHESMRETNKAVSDYLSLKIPEPPRGAPSAIAHKWPLYSPFLTSIIMDLKYSRLVIEDKPQYTRQYLIDALRRYEWLLEIDPAYQAQDERYVVVHPHPWDTVIQMPLHWLRFITKANEMYLKGKVELSGFIQTSP